MIDKITVMLLLLVKKLNPHKNESLSNILHKMADEYGSLCECNVSVKVQESSDFWYTPSGSAVPKNLDDAFPALVKPLDKIVLDLSKRILILENEVRTKSKPTKKKSKKNEHYI